MGGPMPQPTPNEGHIWEILEPGQHDRVEVDSKGNLKIGGIPINAEMRMSDAPIGNAVVNKVGGKTTIKAPDQIHHFIFQSGRWFYRVEKRSLLNRLFG